MMCLATATVGAGMFHFIKLLQDYGEGADKIRLIAMAEPDFAVLHLAKP